MSRLDDLYKAMGSLYKERPSCNKNQIRINRLKI